MATDEPASHEQMLRDVLRLTSEMDLADSPPVIGQRIHRRLRELTGTADPYASVKRRFNRMALDMLPELHSKIAAAQDPFEAAARLAIAGNIIDFGPKGNTTEQDALDAISNAFTEPLHGDLLAFQDAAGHAEHILYLADNAGEIVFDRVFIEHLLPKRVTLAVRGAPVINDATIVDAKAAGLTELVEVIDNGSDGPGTILGDCGKTFLDRFHAADCIIAKGQGNFETLSEESAPLFFLFKAKCPVIAAHARVPIGAQVLLQGKQQSE
jgi:uncharacterized protein with ATP-grasp and redox domains